MVCPQSSVFVIAFLIGFGDAFWWSNPTSTETPPILKQVPVGYFRTYTYQPLSYPQPYPPYSRLANHYPYESPNIGWSQHSAPLPPPARTHYPTPPTTQSTTTTTTSPSTSTPSYQQGPPVPLDTPGFQPSPQINSQPGLGSYSSLPIIEVQSSIQGPSPPSIPTYSQIYPNPELSNYQYYPGSVAQTVPQVQFVPCMCPVTISVGGREMLENRAMPEEEEFLQSNDEEDSSTSLKD